jgi:hypothetical protein
MFAWVLVKIFFVNVLSWFVKIDKYVYKCKGLEVEFWLGIDFQGNLGYSRHHYARYSLVRTRMGLVMYLEIFSRHDEELCYVIVFVTPHHCLRYRENRGILRDGVAPWGVNCTPRMRYAYVYVACGESQVFTPEVGGPWGTGKTEGYYVMELPREVLIVERAKFLLQRLEGLEERMPRLRK